MAARYRHGAGGALGDIVGLPMVMMSMLALGALATIPLAVLLRSALR